jgi:hydroxymethylglutaryl-CoA lyase
MNSMESTSNFPSSIPPLGGQGVSLVECPRDAMQGWKHFIPTERKLAYLQQLLKVGFHTLDCGSFVSAKAIPQMADTAEVISTLDTTGTATKLLVIVANERGAKEAIQFDKISYLGFPFSVSPTFQMRNANSSIEESVERVRVIQDLCSRSGKELVVYLSMAFGNPYGDPYNASIVSEWANTIHEMGVQTISLADTVGLATAEQVYDLTSNVIKALPQATIGVHLHSTVLNWQTKLEAALNAGCMRIDGALKGVGGCPMANDDLVGNMDTELMIPYLKERKMITGINEEALTTATAMATALFQ